MIAIQLPESYQPLVKELTDYILAIESEMNITIDQTNGEYLAHTLMKRVSLLSTCPRMMELATKIYNTAKGIAADEIICNEKLLNLKDNIQRKWFEGKLCEWDALYARAERTYKSLESSIEGIRSLLSYEKQLSNMNRYGQT